MAAAIPRRVREMTPEWLTDVFEEVGIDAPSITAVDIEQINIGTGFAGRVLRLRPAYDGSPNGAPTSLIAKTPSTDPTMRALLAEVRGYELEGLFYLELCDRTPTPVPDCLWIGADVDRGDFLLLLEDLQGYAIGGQTGEDVDPDLVGELVVEAARLHRAWWNDPVLLDHASVPNANAPERLVWRRDALRGYAEWEHHYSAEQPEHLRTGVRDALERYGDLALAAAEGATTLVHGDYRLDNAMRSAGDQDRPLVILDWQLLHRGSGAYDLAYLLGQSVPTELRRAHEDEWLARYLEELDQPGYDQERLRRDFAIGLLLAMVIPLNGAGMNARVSELMAELKPGPMRDGYQAAVDAAKTLMRVISDRCLAAIEDHDALRVLA